MHGLDSGLPVSLVADRMQREVRMGIAEARALSRAAGLQRLTLESLSHGIELRAQLGHDHPVRDLLRGGVYADKYSDNWARQAVGASPSEAMQAANEATLGSLRRIAITESAEAYNSARLEAARAIGLDMWRRWDAKADACPVCSDQDGVVVRVDESFPEGEPGSVHPSCQCSWELISAREAKAA